MELLSKTDTNSVVLNDCDLGLKIRSNRTRLGLSEADFAELVGVSEKHLRKWEAGKSPVPPSTLVRIFHIVGRPLPKLLGAARSNKAFKVQVTSSKILEDEQLELLSSYVRIEDPSVRLRVRKLISELALPTN